MSTLFTALIFLPLAWLFFYGILLISQTRVGERFPVIGLKSVTGLLFLGLSILLWSGDQTLVWPGWINVPGNYDFPFELLFNRHLGVIALAMVLIQMVIIKFSETYLHKEEGFHRFFFLLSIFLAAFPLVVFGDNIDVIFLGWELIGITSVLLIGFYEKRTKATVNSWWALVSYRICDIGLLSATTLAHFAVHTTNVEKLNDVPALLVEHPHHTAWIGVVALMIIFASLAKAAQLPYSSWLLRAMEGPTPSSALYYGALSIGLGPILLLKFQPLILHFWWLQLLVIAIGLMTALYSYLVAKTKADAKSILALSSLFEVSVMVVEVGLGFNDWVVFHFTANAFLRVFQFLRSMNAIQDFYDNPLFYRGAPNKELPWGLRQLPKAWQRKIYYWSMNGFGLDAGLLKFIIAPWFGFWSRLDQLEEDLATGRQEHFRTHEIEEKLYDH